MMQFTGTGKNVQENKIEISGLFQGKKMGKNIFFLEKENGKVFLQKFQNIVHLLGQKNNNLVTFDGLHVVD